MQSSTDTDNEISVHLKLTYLEEGDGIEYIKKHKYLSHPLHQLQFVYVYNKAYTL